MEKILYNESNNNKSNISKSEYFLSNSSLNYTSFPNYEIFKKSLPYINYQTLSNAIKKQSLLYFPEFFPKNKSKSLILNFNKFKTKYKQQNYIKNKNRESSPIKSIQDDNNNNKNKLNNNNNYINLLINSVNKLFEKGEITQEYLNSETYSEDKLLLHFKKNYHLKNISKKKSLLSEDSSSENSFTKKCDNQPCTYIAYDPHKLFKVKLHKSKYLWLCEKCFKAFNLQNYCYYCHVIYREYEHGTQYYDRKKWIQCDFCYKWHHMNCEEKKGKYQNIEELCMNNNFKYMCPFCRKEQESIFRQKHKDEKQKINNNNNCINIKKKFLNIKRKSKLLPKSKSKLKK